MYLPTPPRSAVRLGHQWALDRGLRRFADQRSAVTVARGHEGRGHVAAQQRDVGHVHAVADREGAAGFVGIGRIAQRRARAETDVGEVDGILAVQPGNGPREARWFSSLSVPVSDRKLTVPA